MDLKKEREAAGLNQEQAVELLGIGLSTIWRYESGKTKRLDYALVNRMRELYASHTQKAV